jgi:hypothetical protein
LQHFRFPFAVNPPVQCQRNRVGVPAAFDHALADGRHPGKPLRSHCQTRENGLASRPLADVGRGGGGISHSSATHCGSSCDPTAGNAFERGALTTQAGWDNVATVGAPAQKPSPRLLRRQIANRKILQTYPAISKWQASPCRNPLVFASR